MINDLKYLMAYTIPLSAIAGISLLGWFAFLTPFYVFMLLPVLEILLPRDNHNLDKEERNRKERNKIFDWLLYLNLPLVYGLIVYSLIVLTTRDLTFFEMAGVIFSTGIVIGANGINVGHELGHRKKLSERIMGKIQLLPALYMHFYVEHNFGHHLHAATPEDPATARLNQSVYSFWITSVCRQYSNAWRIQSKLLRSSGKGFFSLSNDMLWFSLFQALYLGLVFYFFGANGLLYALAFAAVGILLLETINYIEHYGLLRLKTESGRYERVREIHSWNSNHVIGRIVLYELTRHSDHHYRASKKYQLLDCHDESPQMPYGYPTSMVLSLFPPLWFRVMNKRIPQTMRMAA
ncbi:alkane 1-monooxygenase [Robertkochia aurantiaca]|uniref:alkane 1-monooxygenase n=1 Tax=Robertkochia aurantiaca TaxID=2873700 RepID=UPI0021081FE3|nr:alkane 1-monooxygenase [Robertkochia sp. 3YJGBD-33]